jgi:hypothetical protein
LIRWQGLVRPDDEEDFLHYSYVREKGYCYLSKWTGSCNLASWMMAQFKWNYSTFVREQTGFNKCSEPKWCSGVNSVSHIEQYGSDTTSMDFDWPILVQELNNMMPDYRYRYVLSGMIDGEYMTKIAGDLGVCRQTACYISGKVQDICEHEK